MLYGLKNSGFGTIKTGLENNMTCVLYSYSRTKDKTMGILNNYHVGTKFTWENPVKEEVAFV